MRAYGLPQGLVESIHRAVALSGGDHTLPLHEELDSRFGHSLYAGPFFGDDPERLKLEEWSSLAGRAADEQRERGVSRFVVVALILPLLYGGEHGRDIPCLQAELFGLGTNRVLPR